MDDLGRHTGSYFPRLSTLGRPEFRLLLVFLGISGLVLIFGLLAEEVIEGDTTAFDRAIFLFFRLPGDPTHTIGPVWLEEAARDITGLGSVGSAWALLCWTIAVRLQQRGQVDTKPISAFLHGDPEVIPEGGLVGALRHELVETDGNRGRIRVEKGIDDAGARAYLPRGQHQEEG